MFDQLIQIINNNPKLKKRLQIGLGIAAAISLILILWPSKSYQQYSIKDTGLVDKLNFARLKGNSLNYYNGLSFISRDLKTGQEKSLSSGVRLPIPDKVFWADDKGALITFKSSFYYTAVEAELSSMGRKIDSSTKLYSWYLDFSTSKLSLASTLPIQSSSALFSAKDNSFYYINDESSLVYESESGAAPVLLNSYNIATAKSSPVAELVNVKGLKGIYECPSIHTQTLVCLIALDSANPKAEKLYKVDGQGRLESILDSKGILLPTYSPNFYATIELASKKEDESEQEEGADVFGPGILLDANSNSSVKLGYDIGGSGFAFWKGPEGDFINLDNHFSGKSVKSKTPYYYRSGNVSGEKASSGRYAAKLDGANFESLFISNSSYSESGDILIDSFDGQQMLFSPIGSASNSNASISDKDSLDKVVKKCSYGYSQDDSEYFADSRTFRIYLEDNQNLSSDIQQLSSCISSANIPTLGYNINILIIDQRSGRIVSD